MKNILVLGSAGMLGHQVCKVLKENPAYNVIETVFKPNNNAKAIVLDISRQALVEKAITDLRPDVIINCIGVLIRGSQESPANAIYINAYFPHQLSQIAKAINAKFIHISTDCVFSGEKGNYTETDEKDAKDVYGKSKGLGELINDVDLTLRTSIIGPELKPNGEGLFHWFMNQENATNGYTNAIWTGVTTLQLAKVIAQSIDLNLTGLYQVTNSEPINKFDLLNLFNTYSKKGIDVNPFEATKTVNKSFIDTRKALSSIPSYETMIAEMCQDMFDNKALYPHYFSK